MPEQAPAATEKVEEAAASATEGIGQKVKEAAGAVKDALLDDEQVDQHDEL
jgi:protein disulfide-isomerase A1